MSEPISVMAEPVPVISECFPMISEPDPVMFEQMEQPPFQEEAFDDFPFFYRIQSPVEIQLILAVQNFAHQFSVSCPDRLPLFLCPDNECGVKKFVCTTLRPTTPKLPCLTSLEGCASFVADFLSPKPLDPPTKLPTYLCSPATVLQRRTASCFEASTLLGSLLLGAGFDAFCVSGYADKETCEVLCVLPGAAIQDTQNLELEKPETDDLFGYRVHCWVLVRSGLRGVKSDFFIEPLTGRDFSTNDCHFLGVESIWNQRNYYINLQECDKGCQEMSFKLEELRFWKPFMKVKERKEKEALQQLRIRIPQSWVSPLTISLSDKELQSCWPNGHKTTKDHWSTLEQFAPQSRADSLITRRTTYQDEQCSRIESCIESFKHRNDFLQQRKEDKIEGCITESFEQGSHFHLSVLRHRPLTFGSEWLMEFKDTRVSDFLQRRLLTPNQMKETFEGRRDFLCTRLVIFSRPIEISELTPEMNMEELVKQVELQFDKNPSKPDGENMTWWLFQVSDYCGHATYQPAKGWVFPTNKSPAESSDFQVLDVELEESKVIFTSYENMSSLKIEQQRMVQDVMESLLEVKTILASREERDARTAE